MPLQLSSVFSVDKPDLTECPIDEMTQKSS